MYQNNIHLSISIITEENVIIMCVTKNRLKKVFYFRYFSYVYIKLYLHDSFLAYN